jgi:hypothetical protein
MPILTILSFGELRKSGRLMFRPLIYLAILAGPLLAQSRIHIAGTVRAGETFRKEIGLGLTLVLTPNDSQDAGGDSGWSIEVQPADQSDNFIRCVILLLHGPTPADILASQFVTEENEKHPESALSEQKERQFQFVLNSAGQKKACDELDAVAYSPPKTAKDGAMIMGTPGYKEPSLGSGTFVIKSVPLSYLGKSKDAKLESLSFEAEIAFPPAKKNRSSKDR